jgi:hypothetical protein
MKVTIRSIGKWCPPITDLHSVSRRQIWKPLVASVGLPPVGQAIEFAQIGRRESWWWTRCDTLWVWWFGPGPETSPEPSSGRNRVALHSRCSAQSWSFSIGICSWVSPKMAPFWYI